jgi:glycerol-3-phosphate dehydrogenase
MSPAGAGRECEVRARLVINATGAWVDDLLNASEEGSRRKKLRCLRGSHLVFSSSRLPITRAVCGQHTADGRFVFAVPWYGVTLVGTTDVDHPAPVQTDIPIDRAEVEYLLEFVRATFPDLELSAGDVQATFSGLRPVVNTGKLDPSKESREHVVWVEDGLLTITGGKLTTFRRMACDALSVAGRRLGLPPGSRGGRENTGQILSPPPADGLDSRDLGKADTLRLLGRYGAQAGALVDAALPGELAPVPGAQALWAELRWAARAEGVVHLDDLLLRRVRLGLFLPRGGLDLIEPVRAIIQPELGWDDLRWEGEVRRYANLWEKCYHFSD